MYFNLEEERETYCEQLGERERESKVGNFERETIEERREKLCSTCQILFRKERILLRGERKRDDREFYWTRVTTTFKGSIVYISY